MELTADCENSEHPSGNESLDAVDVSTSNMNPKLDNIENQAKNQEDIHNLSDNSVSSVDSYTPKLSNNSKYLMPIEITNWEPFLFEDKLVITGNVVGSMETDRVCKQRLSSLIFKDDYGITCCILGPMKAQNTVPDVIRNQFKYIYKIEKNGEKMLKDGIPENWLKLCMIWKCYIDTVNKNLFDWHVYFKKFSFQPLVQKNNGCHIVKTINNGPKTKIKKKFEKYKSMLEQELLRDTIIEDSESDTNVHVRKKPKKRKVINHEKSNYLETDTVSSSIQIKQSSLNKRTTCYINNQIPTEAVDQDQCTNNTVYCQTDLTLNDFVESEINDSERNDKTLSTNVVVLSPTKLMYKPKKNQKSENCAINDQLNKKFKNESNKKIIESKMILKELTNEKAACPIFDTNDDSSSLEFYENIVANSTTVDAKTPAKLNTYQKINYICSKTLEMFDNRRSSSVDINVVENLDVIDIELFSQTVLKSKDESPTNNVSTPALSDSRKNDELPNAETKELKTIKNNLEKSNNNTTPTTEQPYKLRSPKRYIVTTNETKGVKRKKQVELNDERNVKKIALDTEKPVRFSLRKRKKLNYRELLFNRINLPENFITEPKVRKSTSPLHSIKKTKTQLNKDKKLFRKCFVILMRENLELKLNQDQKNTTDAISTSKFTVTTNINVEKENVVNTTSMPQIVQNESTVQKTKEHVFKTPLTTVVKKKLNKTLHIPNYMPKIPKNPKKLSLPANPMELLKIIKSNSRFEKPLLSSPFSMLSDTSSDSSDKKRRKLFSPDNWMQSDGCLKTLSQNQYNSNDGRFSIRFDDTDQNMDSEFSDSNMFTSS